MIGIIGKKLGMTSIFEADGKNVACTVIEAGPCKVTQIKTVKTDGYNSVQLGFGEKKVKSATKPELGHLKKSDSTPKSRLSEIRDWTKDIKVGDEVFVADVFAEGEWIDISGVSKGKGFQGVIKRHNFNGVGGQTHGQHNRLRAPGSLGASSYPSRVLRGMRMAGRTGGERVKVENIKVLKIVPEKNLLVVKGAVPGAKGGYLILTK